MAAPGFHVPVRMFPGRWKLPGKPERKREQCGGGAGLCWRDGEVRFHRLTGWLGNLAAGGFHAARSAAFEVSGR